MSDDRPSVAEIRAHARAIDEGLEHHQQRRRLWLVSKPYRFLSREPSVRPHLVLARNAVEARMLVRDKFYKERRDVPHGLEAVEVDTTASRILDGHDEEIRIAVAQDEARRGARVQ